MHCFESMNASYGGGIRVLKSNINNNDIITLMCNNEQIYCRVTGTTRTMVKVEDLEITRMDNCIIFKATPIINNIHKNYLGFSRKMYIVPNIEYKII